MRDKKPTPEERIAKLEKEVALLSEYLKKQYEVKNNGGDIFANYPKL